MNNEHHLTADQQDKLATFLQVYPMDDEKALQFLTMCDFNLEVPRP